VYSLAEALFLLATVVVLVMCIALGYSVYAKSVENAKAMYRAELNAILSLLEYYPEALVYSPISHEGHFILGGGEP